MIASPANAQPVTFLGRKMTGENYIGTLKVCLSYPGTVKAEQAIQRSERLTDESIIPVLEKVAEDYGFSGISLDTLEIDLGSISEDSLRSALESALRNELDRRGGAVFRHLIPEDSMISVQIEAPSEMTPDIGGDPVEQLASYLSRPEIPWDNNVEDFNPVDIFRQAIDALADADKDTGRTVTSFISLLSPIELVRFRELARKSSDTLPEITEILSSVIHTDDNSFAEDGHRPASIIMRASRREALWKAYMSRRLKTVSPEATERGHSTSAGTHISQTEDTAAWDTGTVTGVSSQPRHGKGATLKEDPDDWSPDGDTAAFRMDPAVSSSNETREISTSDDRPDVPGMKKAPPSPSFRDDKVPDSAGSSSTGSVDNILKEKATLSSGHYPLPAAEPIETAIPDSVFDITDDEMENIPKKLFISDAGLVLTHPFIARFFRNLKLLDEDGQFISGIARIHAVHLLRHITGYEGEHLEHCLTLEKILCGLPPDYLIPEEWEVTPEEEEEIEGLLGALLSYWPSLRKSSVGALQRGFIQRPGSIAYEDGSYMVRVEGSAIDILMEDLPWETSIILLTWLDKPIFVEWQK